ncbi:MAG: hypothetical protein QM680_07180 [Luteolibacter sp.]
MKVNASFNQILTTAAMEYAVNEAEYAAAALFPLFPTGVNAARFPVWKKENMLTVPLIKREWALPTGGYKERTTKSTTEDAFEITVIDYATGLFDQLLFGLASVPVADTAQQAFASP